MSLDTVCWRKSGSRAPVQAQSVQAASKTSEQGATSEQLAEPAQSLASPIVPYETAGAPGHERKQKKRRTDVCKFCTSALASS